MKLEDNFNKNYTEKSEEYRDNLDFRQLELIKSKPLKDLSDVDLVTIGFSKVKHAEIKGLYSFEDLNGIKIYINREGEKVELLGFRLIKERDINSTSELLDATLTKWRLKI